MLSVIQLRVRLFRHLVVAGALFLILGTVALTVAWPAQAAAPAQGQSGTPSSGSMMSGGMMGQGMSMAEMGAMMDEMMASMPMSGTMSMSMADMGQMMGQMQMMAGMMHQQMGQMQMMMGQGMMEGGMMGQGMTGEGMSEEGMSMMQMGHMMQMMGMMHQQMAMMNMMHAMMAGHMSGEMMGMGMMGDGMMGGGMMNQDASPDAAQATTTAESTATAESDATPNATATPAAASGADTSAHPDHPLAATTQQATAGAVTVEVIPLVDDEILDIAFTVTLETHSVELNYDLAEQATLSIGDAEFAPTGWAPDAADGHHVEGTLRFTIDHPAHAEMGTLGEVTLDLGEIDGQPVTLNFAVE